MVNGPGFSDVEDAAGPSPLGVNSRVARGEGLRGVAAQMAVFARSVPASGTVQPGTSGLRAEYMDANQLIEAIRMVVREEMNRGMTPL